MGTNMKQSFVQRQLHLRMQKSSLDHESSNKDITKVMLNEMPSSQVTKMCHDSIKVVIKPKKQYI